MLLKEIFRNVRDLENQGVVEATNENTLIYELETFVCAGKYSEGLVRILEGFLNNIDKEVQQGIWISGFYGSGKSHLIKILCSLWTDQKFTDGRSSRGIANLSQEVKDELHRLSVRAKSEGGLHSAIGKIGAGVDNPRLALLSILFKSKGLPSEYYLADFILTLKELGKLDEVKAKVGDFEKELSHFYLSEKLAKALEEVLPDIFPKNTREILRSQYPNNKSIDIDKMVEMIKRVLSTDGKLPLVLIGLDEVQQYIGNDQTRAHEMQLIVEAISNEFRGRLIVAATGQTAITSTDELKKLKDRFQIQIQLSDSDVDRVVRDIVLAKEASKKPDVQALVDKYNGEIKKQLKETPLWSSDKDEDVVNDYPLLPARRRFWEQCLRAIDESGSSSQLRSQLKTVHSAVQKSLNKELGYLIPCDFLYFDWASDMIENSVITREVYKEIEDLHKSDNEDDKLLSRACALIFLINLVATRQQSTNKLKATLEVITDLMVEDLSSGASIKGKVKTLLSNCQIVDDLGNEGYSIRSDEGRKVAAAFSREFSSVKTDGIRFIRDEKINELVRREINVTVQQGNSRQNRQVKANIDKEMPIVGDFINAWVRDEWSVDFEQFERDARTAGNNSPIIHVFIPKEKENDLTSAFRTKLAAEKVLTSGLIPASDPALRRSMENKKEVAAEEVEKIIKECISHSTVLLSGGEEITHGSSLSERIKKAAQSSIARQYSKFSLADHEKWGKVYEAVNNGNTGALSLIDFQQNHLEHKAVIEVLSSINFATPGEQLYKKFLSPPYGWGTDAVDSIIALLMLAENIEARDESNKAVPKKVLRKTLRTLRFDKIEVPVSESQKLTAKAYLRGLGIDCKELSEGMEKLEVLLYELQENSGGEPPLPNKIEIDHIDEVKKRTTRERIIYICENKQAIDATIVKAKDTADKIKKNQKIWDKILKLVDSARDLTGIDVFVKRVGVIRTNRQLIDTPDYIEPLFRDITDWLRDEIFEIASDYRNTYIEQRESLENNTIWQGLSQAEKETKLRGINGEVLFSDDISDGEKVFAFLQRNPLNSLNEKKFALIGRFKDLLDSLKIEKEPGINDYSVKETTLASIAQVEEWIASTKRGILNALEKGPVRVR